MKKLSLLIVCSLSALAGATQTNNVSVSNFQSNPGASATTVTFNVSWTSTVRDSVWVFVDYNIRGTMERLPLTAATASAGAVHKPNAWGAWVVAPGAGAFSATVTLHSNTTYTYGSCAYAIPQPPKGQYAVFNKIKFTGTPPFELTLNSGNGTETEILTAAQAADTYTIPAGKTLTAFTDATLAPGVFKCTPPTIIKHPENKAICYGKAQLDIVTSPAAAYRWYEGNNSTPVQESSGTMSMYTTATLAAPATYTVTASIGACSVTSNKAVVSLMLESAGTAPGSTVTFAAFNPCADAAVGTVWHLTDNRSVGGNNQTYKVKMMPDGHVWMVQNMRFGNCTTSTFTVENREGSTTVTPTVASGYVGHCGANAAGHLYTWAGALNRVDGWNGKNISSCSGTGATANACQGICPDGWHVPTQNPGEFALLANALLAECGGTYNRNNCWGSNSLWEGVSTGLANCSDEKCTVGTKVEWYYWSSAVPAWGDSFYFLLGVDSPDGSLPVGVKLWDTYRYIGMSVRCVRNY